MIIEHNNSLETLSAERRIATGGVSREDNLLVLFRAVPTEARV